VQSLLSDKEAMQSLWSAAISAPANPRFFSAIGDVRAELERQGHEGLEVPGWWDRVAMEAKRLEKEYEETERTDDAGPNGPE
jgi:hypothetical protein